MDHEQGWAFEDFRLDPVGRQLWRGATALPLRPKLFAVLQYLVEHSGRLIAREELLRAVWSRTHVDETLLRGTMRDLRAALGDDAEAPTFIETVPHQGYRFLAEVRRAPAGDGGGVASRSAIASTDALLERERERSVLDACLSRTLARQRQIVFVTGEAGIGKTALVDAFVQSLPHRHGVLVGRGQCVEQYGGSEGFMPVLEAIGQLCRDRAGKRVLVTLRQHAPTWLVQLPALVSDADWAGLQRRTQGAGRDRMLREMAEALEALSVDMPVALILEDLHWSDRSTVDLLSMLARRREPARLLLLATFRPVDLIVSGHPLRAVTQELHGRGLTTEVAMAFLSSVATVEYLAGRFHLPRESPSLRRLASQVHQLTDGNPLFMINLVDDMVGLGAIAHGDAGWRIADDVDARLRVPSGLQPLIDRQIERLPADDQRVLETASVVGRAFTTAAVAAALEVSEDDVDARCEALAARGVFIDDAAGAGYRFHHDLYQRALYDRLSAARRARLHRRVGEFEVQASPDQVRERAAQLAVHFERAGDGVRAIEHLRRAATNALKREAIQEAIDILRHALALLAALPAGESRDHGELALLAQLSAPLMAARGYASPEAAAVVARARELSDRLPSSPALVPALLSMTRLQCIRGELDDAAALCERFEALTQGAPDPLPLMADSVVAYVSIFRGDLETTRSRAERGVAAYDLARHGTQALIYGNDAGLVCLGFGAWAVWGLGYPEQARVKTAAAIELAQRLAMPYCDAIALFYASWVQLFARDLTAAAQSLDGLEVLSTQLGLRQFMAERTAMRGWLLLQQGAPAHVATEVLEQGLAEHNATGARIMTPWIMASLAEALAAGGQTTRARGIVDEALAIARTTGELMAHTQALTVKGDLCAEASDDEGAVACFEDAIATARRQAAQSMELRAATRLARLRHRQGKVAEARTLLGGAYGWFTEGFDTPDLREARALLDSLDVPAPPAPRARPTPKPKARRVSRRP